MIHWFLVVKIHEEEKPLNQEERGFGLLMVTSLQRGCSGGGNTAGYRCQGVGREVFSHTKLCFLLCLKASPLDCLILMSVGPASKVGLPGAISGRELVMCELSRT